MDKREAALIRIFGSLAKYDEWLVELEKIKATPSPTNYKCFLDFDRSVRVLLEIKRGYLSMNDKLKQYALDSHFLSDLMPELETLERKTAGIRKESRKKLKRKAKRN